MKQFNIAIFHGLGDCVNVTTYLKPIKTKFPKSQITWITYEPYKTILNNNPLVDKIITFNDQGNRPGFACDKRYPELRKQYKNLITPASYISGIRGDKTLLGSFRQKIKDLGLKPDPFEPLMYITSQEVKEARKWLDSRSIDKFVMLETSYGSSQSDWKRKYTKIAIEELGNKGYTILLTHRSDDMLNEYRKIADVHCLDLNYRYAVPFYNLSSGFVGVSSGISCIVHTHQCSKDIPHLEFVRGRHWSTEHYFKKRKSIYHSMESLVPAIRAKI